MDALEQLAERQIILDSAEVEAQIMDGGGPVLGVWRELRNHAIESLAQLVTLNIYDAKDRAAIATHQNEVKRYVEFSHALVKIFQLGKQLAQDLNAKERRDLIELIKGMPESERPIIESGLQPEDLEPQPD
jgi:hypothetical protein